MEAQLNKASVIDPISLFTTIGEEVIEVFESQSLDIDLLKSLGLETQGLSDKTKFKKAELEGICKILNSNELFNYFWSFQKEYSEHKKKARLEYTKSNKIFRKVRHIIPLLRNEFNEGLDILEDISDFLNIEDEDEIFNQVNENIALYRISNFEPDNLNLYAWLRRGELDFYKMDLPEYSSEAFLAWIDSEEWKNHLYDEHYLMSLPEILKDFGLGLVFTKYLKKTVHGAVRWFEGKPLVQISDKGECLATIWYTLFHEFGHVIKHRNDIVFEGNYDLPKSKVNQKEREANSFAYKYLFNGDNLRRHVFSFYNKYLPDSFVEEQSIAFGVDKMFVAYWMKKAQIRSGFYYQFLPKLSFNK